MLFFYFLFSYYLIFTAFYISPQKIFVIIIQKINSFFIIIDNNRFIKEYIYGCFFVSYLISIPFILFYIIIRMRNFCYKNEYIEYILYILRYSHIIAIFFNYLQFNTIIDSTSLFNHYSEGFELSNAFFNIKGFFWDSIYGFITFYCIYFIWFYFPIKLIYFIDISFRAKIIDIKPNISVWLLRICFFIFYFYFFIGLGTSSFIVNYIFFLFFVELIFFVCRFFFFIKIIIL